MKKFVILFGLVALVGILFTPDLALADDFYAPTDLMGDALQKSFDFIMGKLTDAAFKLLFALSLLQITLNGIKALFQGELDSHLGKYVRVFLWVLFLGWMIGPSHNPARAGLSNGADFIQRGADWAFAYVAEMSGNSGTSFSTGDIFNVGINAAHELIAAVGSSMTGSALSVIKTFAMPQVTILTALMLVATTALILVFCGLIAVKVFEVKLELAITIAFSPFSIALGGLDALKEHGMAPFKNMLTLIVRILILGAIVSTMKVVSDSMANVLAGTQGGTEVWGPIWAATFGFVIIGFLALKSDKIAASIMSGSSMISSGDIASSVATGVAAGMAAGAATAALASGAGKGIQSMADFMKNLNTGGGEIKNAGAGVGGLHPFDQQPVGLAEYQASLAESKARAGGGDSSSAAGLGGGEKSGFDMSSQGAAPGSTGSAGRASSAASDALNPASSGSGYQSPFRSGMDEATRARSRAWAAKHSEGNPAFAAQKAAETGSGATAGIAGTPDKMDKVLDALSKQKPGVLDRLGTVNDHVAREQTTVQAHVNVHSHD